MKCRLCPHWRTTRRWSRPPRTRKRRSFLLFGQRRAVKWAFWPPLPVWSSCTRIPELTKAQLIDKCSFHCGEKNAAKSLMSVPALEDTVQVRSALAPDFSPFNRTGKTLIKHDDFASAVGLKGPHFLAVAYQGLREEESLTRPKNLTQGFIWLRLRDPERCIFGRTGSRDRTRRTYHTLLLHHTSARFSELPEWRKLCET